MKCKPKVLLGRTLDVNWLTQGTTQGEVLNFSFQKPHAKLLLQANHPRQLANSLARTSNPFGFVLLS
jgi:hypothetical protein